MSMPSWSGLLFFAMLSLPTMAKAQGDSVEKMISRPPLTLPLTPRDWASPSLKPGIVVVGANGDTLLTQPAWLPSGDTLRRAARRPRGKSP
jgi:hypothetical protein